MKMFTKTLKPDLVTYLVSPKPVTESRVVTDAYGMTILVFQRKMTKSRFVTSLQSQKARSTI